MHNEDNLMATYSRLPVHFTAGEGVWLYDENEKPYLDFLSGIAVNALGYQHPHIMDIMANASKKPWHLSNMLPIDDQAKLAQRLCESSFADRVFFCNSGAEALEGAIKTARRYHFHNENPQKWRVITLTGAFHGRTLATIAATGGKKMLEGFGPVTPGFDKVPAMNMNALKQAVTEETAAILLEPIQGEGGLYVCDDRYLQEIRDVCDEYDLMLIFDEVQCGNARSGKYWAHEWSGVKPDILATAKGLGGGFPIGAVLASEKAAAGMVAGTHGSTFGGNPLAMAVANGVFDILSKPETLSHIEAMGDYFKQGLEALIDEYPQFYSEWRGRGLIIGIALNEKYEARSLVKELIEEGMICAVASGNLLRFLPPLIIEKEHIDTALNHLKNLAQKHLNA